MLPLLHDDTASLVVITRAHILWVCYGVLSKPHKAALPN